MCSGGGGRRGSYSIRAAQHCAQTPNRILFCIRHGFALSSVSLCLFTQFQNIKKKKKRNEEDDFKEKKMYALRWRATAFCLLCAAVLLCVMCVHQRFIRNSKLNIFAHNNNNLFSKRIGRLVGRTLARARARYGESTTLATDGDSDNNHHHRAAHTKKKWSRMNGSSSNNNNNIEKCKKKKSYTHRECDERSVCTHLYDHKIASCQWQHCNCIRFELTVDWTRLEEQETKYVYACCSIDMNMIAAVCHTVATVPELHTVQLCTINRVYSMTIRHDTERWWNVHTCFYWSS